MRWQIVLLGLAVWAAGCTTWDENPKWDPQAEMPSWTYDAPFYYRPTTELQPQETIGDGINVYYTNHDWFFILHPANAQSAGEPRVGVWYSVDRGETWKQAGFFGIEQSHFLFRAEQDGEYWIRFVGPGQGVTRIPPGVPHRVYVVDRKPPAISLALCGRALELSGQENPMPLAAGEAVTLAWGVSDANLVGDSIELVATGARFPDNIPLTRLGEPLADGGGLTVTIPQLAARRGGVRFQMRATDKAGNVGLATTPALATNPDAPPTQPADMAPTAWLAVPTGMIDTGWPMAGAFIRGGVVQTLRWLPDQADRYSRLDLEFSANDGRGMTWRTVAANLAVGRDNQWTPPLVTSKNCQLRIVGILPEGQLDNDLPYVVLAVSPRFTTDTVNAPPSTQPLGD